MLPLLLLLAATDPWTAQREAMVGEQIEARGVKSPAVLRALRVTPRHLFVPETVRSMAYGDHPLPLSQGQTISQPYIVGLMTELAEPHPSLRVLEIGTGSGYQAAVLATLVKHVYTIELVPELARSAAALLKQLKCSNITVREGDGYQGWPEEAPFDRILLTASPDEVPKALLDQLRPGGKLVGPVGSSAFNQELVVIDKDRSAQLTRRSVIPVRFVPMVRGR